MNQADFKWWRFGSVWTKEERFRKRVFLEAGWDSAGTRTRSAAAARGAEREPSYAGPSGEEAGF
jgi:hypothetical protein